MKIEEIKKEHDLVHKCKYVQGVNEKEETVPRPCRFNRGTTDAECSCCLQNLNLIAIEHLSQQVRVLCGRIKKIEEKI